MTEGFLCDTCRFNAGYIHPVGYDTAGTERHGKSTWVKCKADKTRKPPEKGCFDYEKKGWFRR